MKLVRPSEEYLRSYEEAYNEEKEAEGTVKLYPPALVLQKAYDYEHGIGLKPGRVPSTTFWLIENDRFLGEIRVRRKLSGALLNFGGHIGYEIRPSERRKGYGTKMLEMALVYAKEIGLSRVLLTCDDDNIASARVIEKNGGILENKVENHPLRGTVLTRRYWITLA